MNKPATKMWEQAGDGVRSVRRKAALDLLFHFWAGRGGDAVARSRSVASIIPLKGKVGS